MKLEAVLLGLLALGYVSTAQADEYDFSRVALLGAGCSVDGLGAADLRAAIASELSASALALAPVGQASASTDVVVSLREPCVAEEALVLIATWQGNSFERAVTLDELPRASRARALALIVAELLAHFAKPDAQGEPDAAPARAPASTPNPTPEAIELAETPEPSAQPAPIPKRVKPGSRSSGSSRSSKRKAQPTPVDDSRKRSHLAGALELRTFLSGPSLFGGRLSSDSGVFSFGVSAVGGERTVGGDALSAFILQGTAAMRVVTLDVSTRSSLALGPRVGLGYVTVSAQTASANVQTFAASEPYLDGAAFVAFAYRPSVNTRVGVTTELGYARGLVALRDSNEIGHYGGMFASGLIDLAFAL